MRSSGKIWHIPDFSLLQKVDIVATSVAAGTVAGWLTNITLSLFPDKGLSNIIVPALAFVFATDWTQTAMSNYHIFQGRMKCAKVLAPRWE